MKSIGPVVSEKMFKYVDGRTDAGAIGIYYFLAHQTRISAVFTYVRYFYLTYPYQPVGKIKTNSHTRSLTSL